MSLVWNPGKLTLPCEAWKAVSHHFRSGISQVVGTLIWIRIFISLSDIVSLFFVNQKKYLNTRFRKNCYTILPQNRVQLPVIMSCCNLTLIFKAYKSSHMRQCCATKIIAALHENINNCLHSMILQDIHPNKAVKFSNDYLSAGTEVTDGQDHSQTNFGEIFPVFTVDHKYSSQEYRRSAWKLRHQGRQTVCAYLSWPFKSQNVFELRFNQCTDSLKNSWEYLIPGMLRPVNCSHSSQQYFHDSTKTFDASHTLLQ